MCFVIFRASHERLQRTLGRFLSRCCFTLCLTVEVEPWIAKQYKCQYCCSCKNYGGKGKESKKFKKVSLSRFLADQKILSSLKKCILGHPIARATSYCLLPDTLWLQASKNAFTVSSVKSANSLSPPSIKVNAAKGFEQCRAKVKELTTPPESSNSCTSSSIPHLNIHSLTVRTHILAMQQPLCLAWDTMDSEGGGCITSNWKCTVKTAFFILHACVIIWVNEYSTAYTVCYFKVV